MQYKPTTGVTWATNSTAGALTANTYNYAISGLTASRGYDYRAYMVVSGSPYYGNVLHTTTLPIPTVIPTVVTGNMYNITSTSTEVSGNSVSNKGNLPITQYGVLYTQNPAFGKAVNLKYENYPTHVDMKSICADINVNTKYFTLGTCVIPDLNADTETFFRGFAMNSVGCGYGIVKSGQTCTTPETSMDVWMCRIYAADSSSSNGCMYNNPQLTSSQSYSLRIAIEQTICTYGNSTSRLYCRPSGGTYNQVCSFVTSAGVGYGYTTADINLSAGDSICYNHCNSGAIGSWSTISLNGINSHSIDINPIINPISYYDRIGAEIIC